MSQEKLKWSFSLLLFFFLGLYSDFHPATVLGGHTIFCNRFIRCAARPDFAVLGIIFNPAATESQSFLCNQSVIYENNQVFQIVEFHAQCFGLVINLAFIRQLPVGGRLAKHDNCIQVVIFGVINRHFVSRHADAALGYHHVSRINRYALLVIKLGSVCLDFSGGMIVCTLFNNSSLLSLIQARMPVVLMVISPRVSFACFSVSAYS